MTPPVPLSPATDGLTVGRGALHQLRASLLRDAADHATTILQEAGFAAGEGVFQAFCAWLPREVGVARPDEVDAGQMNDVLSAFFRAIGWGAVSIAPLGNAALAVDSTDWVEADPGSAEVPMCFFSSGMLSDFFGRLSGEPVAVMEVECRSRNDERCRFLSASPDTLNIIYAQMTQGTSYEQALGGQ
jgi:predicted hydrocarbon binding protein